MSDQLIGGGKCTICKSPGTNMKTCPLNSKAKKPSVEKHPHALEHLSAVSDVNAVGSVKHLRLVKIPDVTIKTSQYGGYEKRPIDFLHRNDLEELSYWLSERYPEVDNPDDFALLVDDVAYFLKDNFMLRFDRYTMEEILDDNQQEIDEFVHHRINPW